MTRRPRRTLGHIARFVRVLLWSCGVRRYSPQCYAALRRPKMPEHVPDSQTVALIPRRQRFVARPSAVAPRLVCPLPAAARGVVTCDVVISPRPITLCVLRARLAPALRIATMRPARSRRAAVSTRVGAACPRRKHVFDVSFRRRRRHTTRQPVVAPRLAMSPWLAARDAVMSSEGHATSHTLRASRSGLVACGRAAHSVTPRRNIQ